MCNRWNNGCLCPDIWPFSRTIGNEAVLKLGRVSPLEYLPRHFNRHQN